MYRLKGARLTPSQRKRIQGAVGVRRTPTPVFSARGKVRAHLGTFVRFPRRRLAPGRYVFAIRLRAEMNPARHSVLISKAFAVGRSRR
jgi:hypothetical protein